MQRSSRSTPRVDVTGETDKNRAGEARRIDHASRMEASRARIIASRKLCVGTAVIIREARITIKRTLGVLGIGLPPDAPSLGKHKEELVITEQSAAHRKC